MIKVIGLQSLADVDIEVSYTPEVRTYNIISGMMSDDCLPFRVAQHVMVWLNTDGLLGELEAIYPPIVGVSLCTYADHINEQEGFPRLMVVAVGDEGLLQPIEDGFVVWFAQKRMIDRIITFKTLTFLAVEDELVAIVAHQVTPVE
jgi:hypothetical protein